MEANQAQRHTALQGGTPKPAKTQITLRLDTDVIDWFRANVPGGRGYQTEINRVLLEHVKRSERRLTKK